MICPEINMTPMGIMWPKYRRAPLESNHNLGNIAEPMGKPSLQKTPINHQTKCLDSICRQR